MNSPTLRFVTVGLFVHLASALAVAAPPAPAAPATPFAVIEQMETNYGIHAGFRRNHAKGVCAIGEFTGLPEGKALSRSPVFSGRAIPVIARFSAAGGIPTVPDTKKVPRGLGLQFNLGGGSVHNMSMINIPIFPVGTPDGFLESLRAGTPEKLTSFMAKHPESKPFFEYLGGHNPPASYASSAYFSLNAFKFTNADNRDQFVRWQFAPEAGEKQLAEGELAKAGPDYLESELESRLAKGPAQWNMIVTLAEGDDSLTDPSKPWPGSRKTVKVGTLKLAKFEKQIGGDCNPINFDPTRVSDGVAISDDPILKFRSPAYGISFGKRMSDKANPPAAKDTKPKQPAITP